MNIKKEEMIEFLEMNNLIPAIIQAGKMTRREIAERVGFCSFSKSGYISKAYFCHLCLRMRKVGDTL